MAEFVIEIINQYPQASTIILSLVVVLLLFLITVFSMAFIQGRSISFWPPQIGKKTNLQESDANKEIDLSTKGEKPNLKIKLGYSDVVITTEARNDCEILGIPHEIIVDFILDEVSRHPVLFSSSFVSMPIAFQKNIIIFSWDNSRVSIERILDRSDAYPYSKDWYSCVSLYRQATSLRYRTRDTKPLIVDSEIRHVVNLYRKLLRNIEKFISMNEDAHNLGFDVSVFESLLAEAEFALFDGNTDIAVVRLEALLSSIHKFLISSAPHAVAKFTSEVNNVVAHTAKLGRDSKVSILLVDDEPTIVKWLSSILKERGYQVTTANNGDEALKALVEHDYNLVITDIIMPVLDGLEVVKGSKAINPKTKVLILTAAWDPAWKRHTKNCDVYLTKPIKIGELLKEIQNLLA